MVDRCFVVRVYKITVYSCVGWACVIDLQAVFSLGGGLKWQVCEVCVGVLCVIVIVVSWMTWHNDGIHRMKSPHKSLMLLLSVTLCQPFLAKSK